MMLAWFFTLTPKQKYVLKYYKFTSLYRYSRFSTCQKKIQQENNRKRKRFWVTQSYRYRADILDRAVSTCTLQIYDL